MPVEIKQTVTVRLDSNEVKAAVAEYISHYHDIKVEAKDVVLKISGGYDGGHGYGYVSTSFDGAEVNKVVVKEPKPKVYRGGRPDDQDIPERR